MSLNIKLTKLSVSNVLDLNNPISRFNGSRFMPIEFCIASNQAYRIQALSRMDSPKSDFSLTALREPSKQRSYSLTWLSSDGKNIPLINNHLSSLHIHRDHPAGTCGTTPSNKLMIATSSQSNAFFNKQVFSDVLTLIVSPE